jgi:hypothetical protein
MFDYDFYDEHLSPVAQSCRHLTAKSSAKSAINTAEGISCGICSSWDGSHCTRKVFDNVLTKLEMD